MAAPSASDSRDWARKIVERFRAGERINPTVLRFAHEALGLEVPRRAK